MLLPYRKFFLLLFPHTGSAAKHSGNWGTLQTPEEAKKESGWEQGQAALLAAARWQGGEGEKAEPRNGRMKTKETLSQHRLQNGERRGLQGKGNCLLGGAAWLKSQNWQGLLRLQMKQSGRRNWGKQCSPSLLSEAK